MLRFAFELLGAAVLVATATVALFDSRRDITRFSLVAGLGTFLLAFDEGFDVHEAVGRWLYRALDGGDPPLVNHWDDVIVIAIGLVGLAVIAWYREEIARERRFATLFAAGLLVFATSVFWDATASTEGTASWWFEESLELAGEILMLAAFAWRLGARVETTSAGVPLSTALSVSTAESEP